MEEKDVLQVRTSVTEVLHIKLRANCLLLYDASFDIPSRQRSQPCFYYYI